MSSTPEIVQSLINHGARLVARLADGRTALHLAAARGNVDMVKMIMQKSEANEEEEAQKEEARKQAKLAAREGKSEPMDVDSKKAEADSDDSDVEMIDEEDSDEDMHSTTTGSYVKVKEDEKNKTEDVIPEDGDEDDPDVYDVNVLAWDTQCSPLHYAILNGHTEVVKELVQTFGADVLLPIKLLNSYDRSPRGAILTLVLGLNLPLEKAKAMTQTLLEVGASSAQADMKQTTALHYISDQQPEVIETLFQHDEPAAKRAINHLAVTGSSWSPSAQSALMSAILKGNTIGALKLLEAGANDTIEFQAWMKSIESQNESIKNRDSKTNHNNFVKDIEQPIILAVQAELPDLVLNFLARDVNPNTLPKEAQHCLVDDWYTRYNRMYTLLDLVRGKINKFRGWQDERPPSEPDYKLKDDVDYLDGIAPGSYKSFIAQIRLDRARQSDKQAKESFENRLKQYNERKGVAEKKQAIKDLAIKFKNVEKELLSKGAKAFKELYPEKFREKEENRRQSSYPAKEPKEFAIEFDFNVHDLTDETREAYLKL